MTQSSRLWLQQYLCRHSLWDDSTNTTTTHTSCMQQFHYEI